MPPLGTGSLAGVARIAFEAQTGEATLDIERLETHYRRSTAQMSDAAIKLELAQARLQRTLAKGPRSYREQASAELQLRRAEQELRSETSRLARSQEAAQGSLGRAGRGALAGSGLFRGLGRAVSFASTSFLGGAGLVYALEATSRAAAEHEVTEKQLQAAVHAAGLEYGRYREQIERTLRSQRLLSGFTEEETTRGFTTLVRTTGDVSKALQYLSTAQDIARGSNRSLDAAVNIVNKTLAGQTTGLRRIGVELPKNADRYEALAIAQRKFFGAAEAYGKTSTGAQDRLNQALYESEVIIGRGLLPAETALANRLANWLSKTENQRRLQRDVNQAVKVGTEVVHDLSGAVHTVDRFTGSFKHTLELLLALKFGASIVGWTTNIGQLILTMRRLRTATAASALAFDGLAAAEGRAAGVPIGRGLLGSLLGRGAAAVGLAGAGEAALAIGTAAAVVSSAGSGERHGDRSSRYGNVYRVVYEATQGTGNPQELAIVRRILGNHSLEDAPDALVARAESALRAYQRATFGPGTGRGPHRTARRTTTAPATIPTAGGVSRVPRRTVADVELDIARAVAHQDRAAEIRYHRELLARYEAQAKRLEERKNLTAKQKDTLRTLYGEIASEESTLDGYRQDSEKKLADARDARIKRIEAARKQAQEREKRENARAAAEIKRRYSTPSPEEVTALAARRHAHAHWPHHAAPGAAGGVDAKALISDFLGEFNRNLQEYAPNYVVGQWGMPSVVSTQRQRTNSWEQFYEHLDLMRQVRDGIQKLNGRGGFVDSRYAAASLLEEWNG